MEKIQVVDFFGMGSFQEELDGGVETLAMDSLLIIICAQIRWLTI